jgi:hypothetical protein
VMKTTQRSFTAVIQKEGTFTFVAIPFTPREAWGAKPPYRVTGTINGIPVRGTLGTLGKDYFLRLSSAWMKATGMEVGLKAIVQLSPKVPGEGMSGK